MESTILQSLLVNGGLGSTAAVFIWLYIQEKKDRKSVQDENKNLRDQFLDHFKEDINEKIADRDALQQAIAFVKEASNNVVKKK